MFNESQYPILIERGQLREEFVRNAHLKEPEKRGEPPCTHYQMIRYYDKESNQLVVAAFQYLRPDKTIGGSGKRDPKRLRFGNVMYGIERR